MVNENESKEQWCPFAKLNIGGATVNRHYGNIPDSAKCLGSECACWTIRKKVISPYSGIEEHFGSCGLINK
jgi:hypothetical protein